MASPSLDYFQCVSDEFVILRMKKTNLMLNRPLYVGFYILELSKLHMYKIFYDYFKAFYKNRCNLIYTDTDSLLICVETEDIYHDLGNTFGVIMDTSNYPQSHPLHSKNNEVRVFQG